jgi:hypothetical protein
LIILVILGEEYKLWSYIEIEIIKRKKIREFLYPVAIPISYVRSQWAIVISTGFTVVGAPGHSKCGVTTNLGCGNSILLLLFLITVRYANYLSVILQKQMSG